MLKGIKIRLYPTIKQQKLLDNHFNCCRFIYNAALDYKIKMYQWYGKSLGSFEIIRELLDVKKGFSFLKQCKNEIYGLTIMDLEINFNKFFKRGFGFPKFKSKRGKQSFSFYFNLQIKNNKLFFNKHNLISFKCGERCREILNNHKFKRITFSKNKANQYFASILIETNEAKVLPKTNNEIGIDLGLKYFLVTSNGEYVENPRFLKKKLDKIKVENRKLSRKKKGSKNKEKQRIKVAKLYLKVTNQRKHFLHQVSNKLINENQVIAIETLQVKDMMNNHQLAQSISDVSWSEFTRILEYKCSWYNREIRKIGTYLPSSKTCSNCGWVNKDLILSDRTFECQVCNHIEDRDLNASKNILNFSREQLPRIYACGHPMKDGLKQEENKVQTLTL